jgi:RHS repeat-associated protein
VAAGLAYGLQSTPIITTRIISYTYDHLYRLTGAGYSTGESFAYAYDPVGNRTVQTRTLTTTVVTTYQYDAANRLTSVNGIAYTWDNNGNLLATGVSTNTWDVANRLIAATRAATTLQPMYNGIGDRVGQTVGATTTHFALDVAGGLPEVIYTSQGDAYLHLPGVIVAESAASERHYLLPDGLGSVRQGVDETGAVVAYHEYDPYGNPALPAARSTPYGFTGEWWEAEVGLLHLRARWYAPEIGRFITRDPWMGNLLDPESLYPSYAYVGNNPVNRIDPSGLQGPSPDKCEFCINPTEPSDGTRRTGELVPGLHIFDPLSSEQWGLSKKEAQRFLLPVELVAGTVAVEIVFDTDLTDIVGDPLLELLLIRHFLGDCVSTYMLDAWENRTGSTGEVIGPGPGITSIHTATAKEIEKYYAKNGLKDYLSPSPDKYLRMFILQGDEVNIHYAAAYLKQLADQRKGTPAAIPGPISPVMTSHLTDLDDIDMQIIYGAFRAGVESYKTLLDYQRWSTPGDFGRQIRDFLPFYREKARREEGVYNR